jgi:hypothetical protein
VAGNKQTREKTYEKQQTHELTTYREGNTLKERKQEGKKVTCYTDTKESSPSSSREESTDDEEEEDDEDEEDGESGEGKPAEETAATEE